MGLSEAMTTRIDDEFTERDYWNAIVIAVDDNNDFEHYLVLTVNLIPDTNKIKYILSYGFSLYNVKTEKVGHYLYNRNEVAKYLPTDLKGRISPIVINMLENLVNRIKPPIIHMTTEEILSGGSLKRYDNITDLLINKLGYILQDSGVNAFGKNYWVLIDRNQKEITVDDSYQLNEDEIRRLTIEEFVTANLTPDVIKEMIQKRKNAL